MQTSFSSPAPPAPPLLFASSSSLRSALLLNSHYFSLSFRKQSTNSVFISSFHGLFRLNQSLHYHHTILSPVHSTATQEIVETSETASEFVEIGYISSVHGLQGEVRVKSTTDFPELRFSKPGRRWLKQRDLGREIIQEMELVDGRGHPGQKSWILKFDNVDTVEQAEKLVGSTVLVSEEDRPELEENEFYTRDLVGMNVILKETGEPVGTVANVYNSGASDLLHVRLNPSVNPTEQSGKHNQEIGDSGPLVWVPFVEAIVPNVDLNRREMLITPPKGLLELNVRSDERSKKERRQLEWKERKKFQKRLIAAKKKLCEMEQQHVFHGFRYGEKDQRNKLAEQIVDVNSKLLQLALQNTQISSKRWNLSKLLSAMGTESALRISEESFCTGHGGQSYSYSKFQDHGQALTSCGKVAIVLVLEESTGTDSATSSVRTERDENSIKTLLDDNQRLLKIEDRSSVPLILVSPADSVDSLQNLFSNHDYFAFDSEKVWFLEEEKLPVVSNSIDEQKKHKILMKTPWEILQTPVGSGGVISLFSSNNLLDELSEMGVEYAEVRSINQRYQNGQTILGLVNSRNANVGFQVYHEMDSEDHFHMVFSMNFLKRLTKQMNKLQFEAISKLNPYIEKVEKDWVNVVPSSSNSYEFRSSIYSCLNISPHDKVCVLQITK